MMNTEDITDQMIQLHDHFSAYLEHQVNLGKKDWKERDWRPALVVLQEAFHTRIEECRQLLDTMFRQHMNTVTILMAKEAQERQQQDRAMVESTYWGDRSESDGRAAWY